VGEGEFKSKLEIYEKHLIMNLSQSSSDRDKVFSSIQLQCRMFVKAFYKEVKIIYHPSNFFCYYPYCCAESIFLFVKNIHQTQQLFWKLFLYIRTTCFGLNRPFSGPQEHNYVICNKFVNYAMGSHLRC
jgi:hypothetical protein